jgi:hypothetical protein
LANKGWSSAGLKALGDDPHSWTAADAARLLGPPTLTQSQVRALIRMASLVPVGKRRVTSYGQAGRYARCYRASDLIALYSTLEQVMGEPS